MERTGTPFFLLLLFSGLFFLSSTAQSVQADTLSYSPAALQAIAIYNQSVGEQPHLYNGRQNKPYPFLLRSGHLFFQSGSWTNGALFYDGTAYQDVPMLYDLVSDELVILHFNHQSFINLVKVKMGNFSMADHTFIHIKRDSTHTNSITPGFYDLLYNGATTVLAKRIKSTQTIYTQTGADNKVFKKCAIIYGRRMAIMP